jgi:hypothetical protein
MPPRKAASPPDLDNPAAVGDAPELGSAGAAEPGEGVAAAPAGLPFYIATRPLPVATEMGGGLVRAFNPGDQVPRDHVAAYGWWQHVTAPPDTQLGQPETEE